MARLAGDPSVWQHVRFVAGGRLPAPQHDWVRHNLSDAGWRWRVVGRVVLQLLPFVAVFLVVPGIGPLDRSLLIALPFGSMLITVPAYAEQIRDRRLRQHGLAVPERERDLDEEWREQHRR